MFQWFLPAVFAAVSEGVSACGITVISFEQPHKRSAAIMGSVHIFFIVIFLSDIFFYL